MVREKLLEFLKNTDNDEDLFELCKRVRVGQVNGLEMKEAFLRAMPQDEENERVIPIPTNIRKSNSVYYLLNKYRSVILEYREQGYGYGAITKMLAQRGGYNKKTGKAYDRSTIRKVCCLLENKETE